MNIKDLKPEEKVEIKIGVWLMQHGCDVYFNRNSKKFNSLIPNYKIFKVNGSRKKPDIIFRNPRDDSYNAVELKDASKTINLRKGTKIIDYYNEYINSKAIYFIDDKKILIDHFLIGTEYSSEGHLFKEELGFKNNINSENKGKQIAVKYHMIPKFEYNKTHEFIRQLWQDWNRSGKNNMAGVGILLSDSLKELKENVFTDGNPAIISQIYRKRWSQYWSVIL